MLRGLSEHVAAEFRPLLYRLTLELQNAVYDRSAPDESSHFAQLRHARQHAASVTVDLKAEREESSRLRTERVGPHAARATPTLPHLILPSTGQAPPPRRGILSPPGTRRGWIIFLKGLSSDQNRSAV